MSLQPHQQRVVDEKNELVEKLQKLMRFKTTPTFQALALHEQNLLREQEIVMDRYAHILGERIAAWGPEDQNTALGNDTE